MLLAKLLEHLRLHAVGGSQAVITGNRRPLGYVQATLGTSTAVALTLPTPPTGYSCNFAIIQNQDATNAVTWRDDGTDPTTTVGMRIPAGGELQYAGDVAKLKLLGAAGTPIINAAIYA
jgi:hypothetical protein